MSQFTPPGRTPHPQPPVYVNPQAYQPPMQQRPAAQPRPPAQPPRKRNTTLYVILACILILVAVFSYATGYAVGKSSTSSSSSAQSTATSDQSTPASQPTLAVTPVPTRPPVTPKPTVAPKWTTVQTFTGNGNKKTGTFQAPGDWKILWSCQGLTDGTGIDGLLYVSVYGSDGTPIDPSAVSGTCAYGKVTSDSTEEHQGGSVYLDINTGLSWTIQVQELK